VFELPRRFSEKTIARKIVKIGRTSAESGMYISKRICFNAVDNAVGISNMCGFYRAK
jgi:hypothetical protein